MDGTGHETERVLTHEPKKVLSRRVVLKAVTGLFAFLGLTGVVGDRAPAKGGRGATTTPTAYPHEKSNDKLERGGEFTGSGPIPEGQKPPPTAIHKTLEKDVDGQQSDSPTRFPYENHNEKLGGSMGATGSGPIPEGQKAPPRVMP